MHATLLALAAISAVAIAQSAGNSSVYYVTDVVTEYTTFCPASTTFEAYGSTYTVTDATTMTLPCPCTSIYSVSTTAVAVPSAAPPLYSNSTGIYPIPEPTTLVPEVTTTAATEIVTATEVPATSDVPGITEIPTETPVDSTATPTADTTTPAYTGGAAKNAAAGLVGVFAVAACFL